MDVNLTPDGLGEVNANRSSGLEGSRLVCERGLVGRARQGEKQGFLDLFEACKSRLYALTRQATDTEAQAENLTFEIFVQVSRKIQVIRNDGEFANLVCRAAAERAMKKMLRRGTAATPRPIATRDLAAEQGLSL